MKKRAVLDELNDVSAMVTYMGVTVGKILHDGEQPSPEMVLGATKIFDCIRERLKHATDEVELHGVFTEDGQ